MHNVECQGCSGLDYWHRRACAKCHGTGIIKIEDKTVRTPQKRLEKVRFTTKNIQWFDKDKKSGFIVLKNKIKIVWTCCDYCHKQHRWWITAFIHGLFVRATRRN